MDGSWQMKCDSTFQPSAPAMVSSASHEPRAQMEMNAGNYLYPLVGHGLRSKFVGGMQEPVYSSRLYSNNHGSGHADTGNSFLALLSGPPSLLQCDFQEFSFAKHCSTSDNLPAASRSFVGDSVGSTTFLAPSGGLLPENLSNHNLQTRGDPSPVSYLFHDIEISNTAIQPIVPGSKKAREPISSRSQCCGTSPISNLNICSAEIQTMAKVELDENSSKQASSFMSGCPRVFCMGKSGFLLLSNTGLLGIVCSCHYLHMSVLKFCEHSGIHDVNPGIAVHMESGETIAQWRKLYFLKFGIRSPGDESEWDWPEELSATASLMKSTPSASNMSKSDLPHLSNQKNAHRGHNLFSGALSGKQQTTVQDGCNIAFKGFSVTSKSNLHYMVDEHLMEPNVATYATAPSVLRTRGNDGCQSIASIDTLKRNENSTTISSPLQNPISLMKDPVFSINSNAKEGLVDRDAAFSNIELRLGQPPQTGNRVLPVLEPQPFDELFSPQKLEILKQMIHNSPCSREEEFQRNLSFATGPSDSVLVEEQAQLKLRKFLSGVSSGLGAPTARFETENMAKCLMISPFPRFSSQPEGDAHLSINKNLVNEGGVIMPKKLQFGSSTLQFDPTNVLQTSNDCLERQLNPYAPGFNKILDNEKGMSYGKDSCTKIDSGVRVGKLMEPCSFMSAVGRSGDDCNSALVNGKNCKSNHELSMLMGASVGTNFSYCSKRVSSVGQDNCMLGTQLASGRAMQPEGILKAFSFPVSTSMSNQTATVLQQEGNNVANSLLDENMRFLKSTQILELSKQQHELCLHGVHQNQGSNSLFRDSILASIPLHSKEKELQCKSYDHLQNKEPSLRFGRNKDSTRSSESERCVQSSDTHLMIKYDCGTQINYSGSNFVLGVDQAPPYTIRQHFGQDQSVSKDGNVNFQQGRKLNFQNLIKVGSQASQWIDVPSKVKKAVCHEGSSDQLGNVLDWGGQDSDQLGNVSAKRFKRVIDTEDSSKEPEISDLSSGCSAPVITQSTLDVNNTDSSIVDALDNHVVDEGSGIDKSWSSDALESEKSSELFGFTSKNYTRNGYPGVLNDRPCCSLLDELKLLDSLTWKKGWNQNSKVLSVNCKTSQSENSKMGFKGKKRKRMVSKTLDALYPSVISCTSHNENGESAGVADFPSCLSKEMPLYSASGQQGSITRACFVQPTAKQRFSAAPSKFINCKSRLSKYHSVRDGQDSYESELNSDAEFYKLSEVSERKKFREDITYVELENANLKSSFSRLENAHRNTRPVVCGKYGEICSEKLAEEQKPAKIVSLSKVLKASERCKAFINCKPTLTSKRKWKKLNSKEDHGTENAVLSGDTNVNLSMEDLKIKPITNCNVKIDGKAKHGDNIVDTAHASLKLKCKEIRKRSIYELTAKETQEKKILEYAEDRKHGLCNTNSKKFVEHMSTCILDSDVFCCVCQSSSNDEINCLLECSRCLIKVHQACYGISTLPKGCWCCRPCRTNSKDIACVLCGYGGGAMTRALRSQTIVKSLLKVWATEKEGMRKHTTPHDGFQKEMDAFHSTKSGLTPENIETSSRDLLKVGTSTHHVQQTPSSVGNFKVHNSITAAALDATIKQWVHMVCGLWTPATRCPNVDTMSAFDVSGVSRPRADVVCSICNRWGGSCIECRVSKCFVKFHPWCAHQKGLLQSETEGANGEKVGFYGRCVLHAIDHRFLSKHDPVGTETDFLEEKEFTCARTEGYKGRRRDGFQNNLYNSLKEKGRCLVPQDQLNAWIYINGQKFCSQGLPKFPASDMEYDCRKEYARYKQAKGWKHLVVYKSGIHALGLYTSRFISRGEMVVEYVGEIVGQRVADKRENEYQSGRKLQYKSACYFFRIDKEHIIDATRKGGIARFVNHSCQPNCVAKVITIRHDKKVVFFAERDIFPGEEITYDYHFNHEDEGKKLPCYCNSKNCRRYLN
ncbi:hypothetical protein L6164_024351 [Bauhinia variegata]|uniref:Uncharacterized protein n=1 Tax=Bauhinia variegata TaxID=167791 RepID=A0ACB9LY44_BAUVA|nr:hypothetical protein L6164_024351 [Bauhinia variegata]